MGEKVVHSAIPGGGCIVCHQSHGSDYRELLVDQYPAGDYVPATTENFGLCFLCHDTDLLDAEDNLIATYFIRVPIFDPLIEGEYWWYDNNNLKNLQVRFYDMPTNVVLSDGPYQPVIY